MLPTMSLPSSSLHMSLPKFKGDVGGIKIGVVGKAESIQELVSALEASDQLDLVDVGKGLIGVARDGELLVTLVTSTSLELVRRVGLRRDDANETGAAQGERRLRGVGRAA